MSSKRDSPIFDGVVKKLISCVAGFSQTLGIPHVYPRVCEKYYILYIDLLEVCAYRT